MQNATETHHQLSAARPEVGLLHGRIPTAEKAAMMALFAGGQMSVLVATTVIEVGVDVPNAVADGHRAPPSASAWRSCTNCAAGRPRRAGERLRAAFTPAVGERPRARD